MGLFDTFIDERRVGDRRDTQCKAFGKLLNVYNVGDVVEQEPACMEDRLEPYYVETLVPFRFIKIEGMVFRGIFDITEIPNVYSTRNIFIDYYGNEKIVDIQTLIEFSKLWDCYLNKGKRNQLPFVFQDILKQKRIKP